MSSEADVKFEIGHVLFIDIVGYSKLLIHEQTEQLQKLREIARATEQFCLCSAELLRCAGDFPELLQLLGLLVNEQLGITDDVDKKNVPDFEFHIGFGRHAISLPRSSESDEIGGRKSEVGDHGARRRRGKPAACNSRSRAGTSCATISFQRLVSTVACVRTSFTAALTRSVGAASTP